MIEFYISDYNHIECRRGRYLYPLVRSFLWTCQKIIPFMTKISMSKSIDNEWQEHDKYKLNSAVKWLKYHRQNVNDLGGSETLSCHNLRARGSQFLVSSAFCMIGIRVWGPVLSWNPSGKGWSANKYVPKAIPLSLKYTLKTWTF